MEGDLIECLNAGDGSWWMGRLRRDKRAVGLFPSNFVQVLDDSFVPLSRATSPQPGGGGSTIRAADSNPDSNSIRKKASRRPFQSYAAAMPSISAKPTQYIQNGSESPSRSPSRQAQDSQGPSRPSSSGGNSTYGSRAPSPAVPTHHHTLSRNTSPEPLNDCTSSPPPPPPPHRVNYVALPRATPSPTPSMGDRYPAFSRQASPAPTSPGLKGFTPSPLRDAMDDVMSSLHDMGVRREVPSPSPQRRRTPIDPWSPEAFEELRTKSSAEDRGREETFHVTQDDYQQVDSAYDSQHNSPQGDCNDEPRFPDGPTTYVMNGVPSRPRSLLTGDELFLPENDMGPPPAPPRKNSPYEPNQFSSSSKRGPQPNSFEVNPKLRNRKSAYELGRNMIDRTFTTKSTATNSSSGVQSDTSNGTSSTQRTCQSIMSGYSAGGFSATSAGSLAKRRGWGSIRSRRPNSEAAFHTAADSGSNGSNVQRPQTSGPGTSTPSNGFSRPVSVAQGSYTASATESDGILGGLTSLKPKRSGFFKKLVESAKTGAASARSSLAPGQTDTPRSPLKNLFPNAGSAIAGGIGAQDEKGLGGSSTDWVQIRRDVNRSNSLSRNERTEKLERCQMMDRPAVSPIELFAEATQGDESFDGFPISTPTNFHTANLQLVDKSARFVVGLPPMTTPSSLAQGYVCRPYRNDVQKLRAIFTWVSEKIAWEEDFDSEVDTRRTIQMKRGSAQEVAVLVLEMCSAVGLHAEVVRGYLKSPGETLYLDSTARPNHWWNAVSVDGEWRMMDCSLASPTNPKRSQYSSANPQVAESWWFLTRPTEICYTHVPCLLEQQHVCPPVARDILIALPCTCSPYFKNSIQLIDYNTSSLYLEGLELVHIQFSVPADIECYAEVEACSYARDSDGDVFESGDTITKRALAQAEWINGSKCYTVKALLPGDEGQGILKVYAGKRGLMHSIKDNPHPLAFALPIVHTGTNPPYEFLTRHPTPHAMRNDLYVAQPQCKRLAINNTFVFAVRQHPASLSGAGSPDPSCMPPPSPSPLHSSGGILTRPTSAMSMISSSTSTAPGTSNYFDHQPNSSTSTQQPSPSYKPAKLAIQSPSGKILRLTRKAENTISRGNGGCGGTGEAGDGGVWETIIKCGERGTWRGLVLADRSARWCVWGEWDCV
ncbi:cytokinesis protein 3 [Bachmanniomyces sp. S44760]|nr:cytokinesis protein 3 [Bachmanniomyces sp. S44760]